jgi:hypothetical protein
MAFDAECKEALLQMRDFLEEIDQKISHILEQNRIERQVFFRNHNEKKDD